MSCAPGLKVLFSRNVFYPINAQPVLPGFIPSPIQDFAFSIPELREVYISQFLQPVVVPLNSSPALQCVDYSLQFGIIHQILSVPFCWPGQDVPLHPKTWTTMFSLCDEAMVCQEWLFQPVLGTILCDISSLHCTSSFPAVWVPLDPLPYLPTFILMTESLDSNNQWLVPCLLCYEKLLRHLPLSSQVSPVVLATPGEKNWPPSWCDKLAWESDQYTAPQASRLLAGNCLWTNIFTEAFTREAIVLSRGLISLL